jgi:CMP-N-acetylneuraminic acid synthetase
MKLVCISLSRAGSKRFPNKIIQRFNSAPLYFYTLDFMAKLGLESYCYTDIKEIETFKKQFKKFDNIQIREKPERFAGDTHLTNIELTEYNKEINADVFIYLPMTSPIRDFNNFVVGLTEFLQHLDVFDCAMSVKKVNDRMIWFKDDAGKTKGLNFLSEKRTFNNDTTFKNIMYEETGSFYIFKKELLNDNFFINSNCFFIEDNVNIDIDTPEDLKKAENYLKGRPSK